MNRWKSRLTLRLELSRAGLLGTQSAGLQGEQLEGDRCGVMSGLKRVTYGLAASVFRTLAHVVLPALLPYSCYHCKVIVCSSSLNTVCL